MEKSSSWKKEFSRNKKKKNKPITAPLNINEEKLIFPPLQTVFDLPPYENQQEEFDEKMVFKKIDPQPVVEGMSSKQVTQSFKKSLLSAGNAIKKARTYIYDEIYEACYWFVKTDIQLLNNSKHKENPSDKQIKRDAKYLQIFIILLLIIPLCVYSSYNWYYLLFFQEGLVRPMDLEGSSIFSDPIVSFILEFILTPVKLLDLLLFKWIPVLDTSKNISPFQSINYLLILAFIVLFTINYMENQAFNIGLICLIFAYAMAIVYALSLENKFIFYGLILSIVPVISLLSVFGSILGELAQFINIAALIFIIVIIAWGKWAFFHIKSVYTSGVPLTWPVGLFNGLLILFRLILSISLVPLAIFFVIFYILRYSFFGIMLFEKNWWSVIQGLIPFMKRNDNNFMVKHNLNETFLKTITDFMYGRFIWVAYIVLCLFYILQMNVISSANLRHSLYVVFSGLIIVFSCILYLTKRNDSCDTGGFSSATTTVPTVNETTVPTTI